MRRASVAVHVRFPVLLMVALFILFLYYLTGNHAAGGFSVQYRFGLLAIIGIGSLTVLPYSKWMTFVWQWRKLGIHRFSIQVNVKTCIEGACWQCDPFSFCCRDWLSNRALVFSPT